MNKSGLVWVDSSQPQSTIHAQSGQLNQANLIRPTQAKVWDEIAERRRLPNALESCLNAAEDA